MHGSIRLKRLDFDQLQTPGQLIAATRYKLAEARQHFWSFRRTMHPEMYDAWWQCDLADEMQNFYVDLVEGKRPKLVIQAPPQHGKSETVRDFIAWASGQNPNLRTVFTSYSDELGMTTNLYLQRMMLASLYQKIFYGTQIRQLGGAITEGARRNTGLIEFIGARGSFRNTTIMGQINGFGLDLGVIDDPIKGRAEAHSKPIRDKTWNWLTDDFLNRFSKDAGMLVILTRWHLDDPVGRWLERFPDTRVLKYAAIAEDNDWTVREGYRDVGDALFPEHKPLEFLLERKQAMSLASWESEFQQNPVPEGGTIFPVDKITVVPEFDRKKVRASVRYVDKAGTQDGGAYSAMVLMHRMHDKTFVVEDVVRGQWSALQREQRIRQVAEIDKKTCPAGYRVWVEQEPGSGGKESAENTIRNLSGFSVMADRVSSQGSKEIRAEPFAAQVQGGNVSIKAAQWNRDYLEELSVFPSGKYKDQVDASAGAFNKLVLTSTYNSSGSWI